MIPKKIAIALLCLGAVLVPVSQAGAATLPAQTKGAASAAKGTASGDFTATANCSLGEKDASCAVSMAWRFITDARLLLLLAAMAACLIVLLAVFLRRATITISFTVGLTALTLFGTAGPFGASSAYADDAPAWEVETTSQPTYLKPGSTNGQYLVYATNIGGAATSSPITITDTLPVGLTPKNPTAGSEDLGIKDLACSVLAQTVQCKTAGPLRPGYGILVKIPVEVAALPDPTVLENTAKVEGGGPTPRQDTVMTTVSNSTPPFEFIDFGAPTVKDDGFPVTEAGAHEIHASIIDAGFPTVLPGNFLTSAGHLRDITVDLPPGFLANPQATPTLCTEAELVAQDPGCPESSQVGIARVMTVAPTITVETTPIYNMVAPPGTPAALAFDAAGVGIFVHVVASLRTDGDYGASGSTRDVLALGANPILSAQATLWGDPSDKSHDFVRGKCLGEIIVTPCEVPPQTSAFLAMPGDCPGEPLDFAARADSWEEPGIFKEAKYESADLDGNPYSLSGCQSLQFEPTIEAQPTTSLADSPTGLDVTLHQPQNFEYEGFSTATVKDVTVTLPEGMSVNASSANGLRACTSAEVGLTTPIGQRPIHFDKEHAACPDAAKIGTAQVSTPLLEDPLPGALYLAEPFDNPFDSLIAIYLVIDDPQTGIVAKLAGEVRPNPVTGQLSSVFEENPQLPAEDIVVHLFDGPRAGLQTPAACGTYETSANLVPWSDPAKATKQTNSFAITGAPSGPCPASPPHQPGFTAGTISSVAATYSPLALRITRGETSQRLARIETTLPPGLVAKLAGVPYCTEAQIAAAQARSQPEQGALEQASPSCPAASQVGTVNVSAGAGSDPLNVKGSAYLAGPYKGAPVSIVIVTPAVAGPFDLGAVVVRTAVYLDPKSAQARAISDPLPTILHGIPVDLRSASIRTDRPQFTLNPTSCDPMAFFGTATSTLGQLAPLSERFQASGCSALRFKPGLSIALKGKTRRGGHPALTAVAKFSAGEANVARATVTLPRSAFIDQAHIRTVCTRVQFAADQCPKGAIYGHARAFTPLLDDPLEGPVYLRSSDNELPDLVAALSGQVKVELIGRIDSIRGGIRNTFEATPDAPVSKFVLRMQGGRKGLIINSTNLCRSTNRATVKLRGHNGSAYDFRPLVKPTGCKGKGKGKGKKRGSRRR